MPTLASTVRLRPWTENGRATASRTLVAIPAAASRSAPGARMANSSPPNRATIASGGTTPRSLGPMSRRSTSPEWCPRASFSSLK